MTQYGSITWGTTGAALMKPLAYRITLIYNSSTFRKHGAYWCFISGPEQSVLKYLRYNTVTNIYEKPAGPLIRGNVEAYGKW
jgi:hypothetical protein